MCDLLKFVIGFVGCILTLFVLMPLVIVTLLWIYEGWLWAYKNIPTNMLERIRSKLELVIGKLIDKWMSFCYSLTPDGMREAKKLRKDGKESP